MGCKAEKTGAWDTCKAEEARIQKDRPEWSAGPKGPSEHSDRTPPPFMCAAIAAEPECALATQGGSTKKLLVPSLLLLQSDHPSASPSWNTTSVSTLAKWLPSCFCEGDRERMR